MKSRFLFAAAAAVALGMTSCSQDDVVEQSSFAKEKAITFGTYLSNAPETRGIVTTTTNLEEFGVTAFSTGAAGYDSWQSATPSVPNFMYNQKVVKNSDGKFEYSPIKYWPTGQDTKVSFFAHSPIDSEYAKLSLPTYAGTPYVNVTVADETKDMIDFVAACAIDKTHATDNGDSYVTENDGNKVTFNLKHRMTRLSFVASLNEKLADDQKTTVVIKSITLKGTNIFAKKGTYNLGTETWTLTSPVNEINMNTYLDFNKNKTYSNKTYAGYTIGLYGDKEVNLVDQAGENAGVDAEKQYIFFLPAGTNGVGVAGAQIVVDYDIVTADENLMAGYSCTSATKTITLDANLSILAMGAPYKFHLKFDVDQIILNAAVTDWTSDVQVNETYTYGSDTTPNP